VQRILGCALFGQDGSRVTEQYGSRFSQAHTGRDALYEARSGLAFEFMDALRHTGLRHAELFRGARKTLPVCDSYKNAKQPEVEWHNRYECRDNRMSDCASRFLGDNLPLAEDASGAHSKAAAGSITDEAMAD
jgi:hypothetical protein